MKTRANKRRHTHIHTLPPFSQQQAIAQGGIWFKLENQLRGLVLYFLRQMVLFCNESGISPLCTPDISAGQFFVVVLPVHIHGLYPPNARNNHPKPPTSHCAVTNKKYFQISPNVPWGWGWETKMAQIGNH